MFLRADVFLLFGKKGSFQGDSREFRDSREIPACGKQRRIRPFLDILLENLKILEIRPVNRPLRNDPFFRSRISLVNFLLILHVTRRPEKVRHCPATGAWMTGASA